jgi:small GTP-binding protein
MDRIKLILVGDKSVGKTSIITQFSENQFSNEYIPTIGSDKIMKEIEIKGEKLNLEIWDTVGQEQYRTVNKIFIKNAQIALIVYDITDKDSFNDLNFWLKEINDNNSKKAICCVLSNKSDLYENQVVDSEEGKNFAAEKKMKFFETSAKDYESIENVFFEICEDYLVQKKRKEEKQKENIKKKEADEKEGNVDSDNILDKGDESTSNCKII